MFGRVMWMGVRGRERWVPTCAIQPNFSSVGWQSKSQGLNGGANVRSSFASHKEYDMTWPLNTRDALRPIKDMASGMHGSGLIYFLDPMAADKNALPEHWAFPGQAALDGPVLVGNVRPTAIDTPEADTNSYPSISVEYDLSQTSKSIYVPVPPGYVAWFGWRGTSDGWGGVRVRPVTGSGYGTPVFPEPLDYADTTRVDTLITGCTGIEIDFAPQSSGPVLMTSTTLMTSPTLMTMVASPATKVRPNALAVQILPVGEAPSTGDFVNGQGNSGCKFENKPTETPYSTGTPDTEYAMAAKLTETGAWV